MQALNAYSEDDAVAAMLPANDRSAALRSFDREEELLQCFIEASRAAWCGCGAIFDATNWSACPCCAGNTNVYAVPLMAAPRHLG